MNLIATEAAKKLLQRLKDSYGSDLLFHQSGGCCDGSAPMCYQQGDFLLGDQDIQIGNIDQVPFYMHQDQFERWQHTDLIIDAVEGGGGMFSLDNGTGYRFLTRSEVCALPNTNS